MDKTEIIVSAIGLIGILLPSYWAYSEKKQNRKKDELISDLQKKLEKSKAEKNESQLRSEVVERLLDITLLSNIRSAVNTMFEETRAERFLILIAINGKIDFNMVSVIFEQHKSNNHINAIARYRNIQIDDYYRQMLKKAERTGVVEFEVDKMPDEALLTQFYKHEGVKNSKVRHLLRQSIDGENDVVIFSSVATFDDEPFTLQEKSLFLALYDSAIIPALKGMLSTGNLI